MTKIGGGICGTAKLAMSKLGIAKFGTAKFDMT